MHRNPKNLEAADGENRRSENIEEIQEVCAREGHGKTRKHSKKTYRRVKYMYSKEREQKMKVKL